MDRDELTGVVGDTTASLAAKVQAAVIDNRPDDALRWAEALATTLDGLASLQTDDD